MTNLPTTFFEADAVATISHWVDLMEQVLTTDAARAVLRRHIRERLLRQEVIPRMWVIAAAEGGNQDADIALRELAAAYISRREEMPTELAAYVQRALLRSPTTPPRGRNVADTWLRDIAIAFLVRHAMAYWGIPATRSHHSKKGNVSACYLVACALRGRANLTERAIEKIAKACQRGAGASELARKLSATIPSPTKGAVCFERF